MSVISAEVLEQMAADVSIAKFFGGKKMLMSVR